MPRKKAATTITATEIAIQTWARLCTIYEVAIVWPVPLSSIIELYSKMILKERLPKVSQTRYSRGVSFTYSRHTRLFVLQEIFRIANQLVPKAKKRGPKGKRRQHITMWLSMEIAIKSGQPEKLAMAAFLNQNPGFKPTKQRISCATAVETELQEFRRVRREIANETAKWGSSIKSKRECFGHKMSFLKSEERQAIQRLLAALPDVKTAREWWHWSCDCFEFLPEALAEELYTLALAPWQRYFVAAAFATEAAAVEVENANERPFLAKDHSPPRTLV